MNNWNLSTRRLTPRFAAIALLCLQACGGRSVNLDGAHTGTTTSIDGGTVVETTALSERLDDYWVDDARLYWKTISNKLQSCVYDNCKATLINYGAMTGNGLTLSSDDLFWIAYDTKLVHCPKTGCVGEPEPFTKDRDLNQPTVAADEDYLYWSSTYDIYRCPVSSCGEVPQVVAAGETAWSALHLQGDGVYWVTCPGDPFCYTAKAPEIHSAPKDGSLPPTSLVSKDPPGALAGLDFVSDATSLYWLDTDFHIVSCPLTGCENQAPVILISTDTQKRSLQVDAVGLYWLEGDGFSTGTIRFCSLATCSTDSEPQMLTSNDVESFELSSQYVYWLRIIRADDGYTSDHNILRTAKPSP